MPQHFGERGDVLADQQHAAGRVRTSEAPGRGPAFPQGRVLLDRLQAAIHGECPPEPGVLEDLDVVASRPLAAHARHVEDHRQPEGLPPLVPPRGERRRGTHGVPPARSSARLVFDAHAPGYLASGSGRSWKCTARGLEPLPRSISQGARSPLDAHSPRPFQPAFGSSMRPSNPLA